MYRISIRTGRRCDIVDITPSIRTYLREIGAESGTVTVFCPHTTAGLTVNENADPDVRRDLNAKGAASLLLILYTGVQFDADLGMDIDYEASAQAISDLIKSFILTS